MSPEKEPEITSEETQEESTIFGVSPTKYNDKPKAQKGKMLKTIIILLLVVAVLCGSAVAIVRFIPKPDTEDTSSQTAEISLVKLEQKQVESLAITHKEFSTVYKSELIDTKDDTTGESKTEVNWSIEGIDSSLTDSNSISAVVGSATKLAATRKIEKENGADYGFEKPEFIIEIVGYDKKNNKTITVGKKTPTESGYYATVDGGQTVHIISTGDAEAFDVSNEEMSTTVIYKAAEQNDKNAAYFEENALAKFDYITLSGKAYEKGMKFTANSDEIMGAYVPYVMTAPATRYADTKMVTSLLDIAKTGLSAESAYVFKPTAADKAKYGLNNPDIELNVVYGDTSLSFKAALFEEGYYALYALGAPDIIFKVSADSIAFGANTVADFAGNTVFTEAIIELKNIAITSKGKTYNFNVKKVESEGEQADVAISLDGRELTTQNFKNYYQYIVGISMTEVTFESVAGTPAYTVVTTRVGGQTAKLELFPHSDRRYYIEVNDTPIGFMSTTTFDKLVEYLPKVINDEKVPEMY